MARKNPLLFNRDEYKYLHRVFLQASSRAQMITTIQKKRGVGLSKEEIMFVKKKFAEWQEKHGNELLWMK